jgi:hypothetical protein
VIPEGVGHSPKYDKLRGLARAWQSAVKRQRTNQNNVVRAGGEQHRRPAVQIDEDGSKAVIRKLATNGLRGDRSRRVCVSRRISSDVVQADFWPGITSGPWTR